MGMRRSSYRRWVLLAQVLVVMGLGMAALWNAGSVLLELADPGWWGISLGLPGLLLWLAALAAPRLLAGAAPLPGETYRLVYDAPQGWRDDTARSALVNLARSAGGMSITWARDGFQDGSRQARGCWISVPEGWGDVLRRLVGDVFPGGQVEPDQPPEAGAGVVILRWQAAAPDQADLCLSEGVEGVYYRWRDPETATVALWGMGAEVAARRFAGRADLWPGQGERLCRPPFAGDNPWPGLPAFPASQSDSGLASISRLRRLEPALRVTGQALVVGHDAEGAPAGFALPRLEGVRPLWIVGQAAGQAAVRLACQALQAGVATLFLDGEGGAISLLSQRLMREMALGRVLVCDVDRPAQARFRLNPFWLPAAMGAWPQVFPAWLEWLREMGVTPAGLGLAAYRHSQVAVVLSAMVAAGQEVTIDPPGLCSALDVVDFLRLIESDSLPYDPLELLGEETWAWWLAEGRHTQSFDVHLRLGHLRDRLNTLLALPEYSLLWQAPYLDPLAALSNGTRGLLWRMPDPAAGRARRRLRAYVTSQLLALVALLAAWPSNRPLVVFLHELDAGGWIEWLMRFKTIRLVLAAGRATSLPPTPAPRAALVSRLDREDAALVQPELFPDVRPADLRRLPDMRQIFWRDGKSCTVDLPE
jgi:hypothetical protein